MIKDEAIENLKRFYNLSNPSKEDFFLYEESLKYLIDTENNVWTMCELAGHYNEMKDFKMELKYYEMAAVEGELQKKEIDEVLAYEKRTFDPIEYANVGLGYIYYYGQAGEKNYEKAFKAFSKAAERGSHEAKYKLADMYKNGYYVEKDMDKFIELIEELYKWVKSARRPDHVPEIISRMGMAREYQGKKDEALKYYLEARTNLEYSLYKYHYWGHMSIMQRLIDNIYALKDFDESEMNLYDLFHVLKKPCLVTFKCDGDSYEVESVKEEDGMGYRFGDKWYRDISSMIMKSKLGFDDLISNYDELYSFEVIYK